MTKFLSLIFLSAASITAGTIYVSPSGSDSTGTGSFAQPYATFSHALSTVSNPLAGALTVDGQGYSYSEPLNTSGVLSSAQYALTIQNATFTGTFSACPNIPTGPFSTAVCVNGGFVILSSVTVNATARDGLECAGAVLSWSGTTIGGTLTNGINTNHCTITADGSNSISGFSSSSGIGAYIAHQSDFILNSGSLTITGPGGTAIPLNMEFMGTFEILDPSATLSVSGGQYGILVTGKSNFSAFVGGTVHIGNSTTPSSSSGIALFNGSDWDMGGGTLTIDHYTTCITAVGVSMMSQGPGGRTLTNCSGTNSQQGSQIVVF